MYLYYLLGYKLALRVHDARRRELLAENTFILTLDGDVDFQVQKNSEKFYSFCENGPKCFHKIRLLLRNCLEIENSSVIIFGKFDFRRNFDIPIKFGKFEANNGTFGTKIDKRKNSITSQKIFQNFQKKLYAYYNIIF